MKTFIYLTWFEVRKNISEYYTLIMFIAVPILLTFILGTTVSELLVVDLEKDNLFAVSIESEDELSKSFIEFMNYESVVKYMQYEIVSDSNTAIEKSKEEHYSGYIIFPKNATISISSNEPLMIEYYAKSNTTVIKGILSRFVTETKLNIALIENDYVLDGYIENNYIVRGEFNPGNSFPKAIDYYAIQSMLQMLIFSAILGANAVSGDYVNSVYIRVGAASTSNRKLLATKIVGNTVYATLATIISLTLSKVLFNVNIEGNYAVMLLGIILYIIVLIGIGMIIGSLVKSIIGAIGITIVIMLTFSSVSGGITPIATNQILQKFTPNFYIKNILFGSIYGYDSSILLKSFVVLVLAIIIIYTLAIILQRRKVL